MPDPASAAARQFMAARVNARLWRRIRQAAIEQHRPIATVVEEALAAWLARQVIGPVVLVEERDVQDLVDRIPRRRRIRHAAQMRAGKTMLDVTASPDPMRGTATVETRTCPPTSDSDLDF